MAATCRTIQEYIETRVETPIETWENQQEQRCRNEPCNWWMLCLNRLICWLVWVLVKVVRIVVVTVGKWVTRAICELTSVLLDLGAFLLGLLMSIPIIGGIIRTIVNWISELIWRIVGLFDLGLSLVGIRVRKKMYVGVVIPKAGGVPITSEAAILPQIHKAQELYRSLCNIDIVYTGTCVAQDNAPGDALNLSCGAGGFFSDWWLGGSYYEFATAGCKFGDGWRRITGIGAEVIVIPISNVMPDSATSLTVGCSFASTHNYVVVEAAAGASVAAHEIGHACLLTHSDDSGNLMYDSSLAPSPTLSNWQISVIRWSKHCVYI